jgi:hypothetical protein
MPFIFAEMGLTNFLPGLVLKHDPPNLHLLSSWDYRSEPLYTAQSALLSFVSHSSTLPTPDCRQMGNLTSD